jgi:hypothetical protein
MNIDINDELSKLFTNSLKIIDKKIYDLILHDFYILTDYYIKILKNENDFNFCIDPCPELDMYMNEENIYDMYTYLSYDNTGYKLLFNMIKEKYNIKPEENILNPLLDYYFEFLLN